MTRSGLPRLRCCVCHLHHKWAMKSPAAVRQFFKTVLQQVCHFKVDVIAGDANAAAHKYYKKPGVPRSVRLLSCRHTERDATRGQATTSLPYVPYQCLQSSARFQSQHASVQICNNSGTLTPCGTLVFLWLYVSGCGACIYIAQFGRWQ